MRNEQVEAVQGEMLHRDSDEPLVASELNVIIAGRLPRRSTLSCHTVPRRAASC